MNAVTEVSINKVGQPIFFNLTTLLQVDDFSVYNSNNFISHGLKPNPTTGNINVFVEVFVYTLLFK